jgi:hypothetical protein
VLWKIEKYGEQQQANTFRRTAVAYSNY